MLEARSQAERYARPPSTEPPPSFVLVLDVGHSLEIYADFTQKGRALLPFPDARSHRVLLVATLRPLHDQIDAVVADAYGWPWPLSAEEILTRVVALNAVRAAEKARSRIRWLRHEFQAPTQQGLTLQPGGDRTPAKSRPHAPKKSRAKPAWSAARSSQVEAVFAALGAVGRPATAKDLAATFARADAKAIAENLSALVTLGRIHRGETRGTFVA